MNSEKAQGDDQPTWFGESLMREALDVWFHQYTPTNNYRPAWLKGLELDRYYPCLELAFEFQGDQHFERIAKFQSKKDFQRQQHNDKKKVAICRQRGISLVWIWSSRLRYTEFRNAILKNTKDNPHIQEIKNCLGQGGFPSTLSNRIDGYIETIKKIKGRRKGEKTKPQQEYRAKEKKARKRKRKEKRKRRKARRLMKGEREKRVQEMAERRRLRKQRIAQEIAKEKEQQDKRKIAELLRNVERNVERRKAVSK